MAEKNEKILEVKNLKTYFYTDDGEARAVDGLSYYVKRGESVGLVGESGCGKSISSLSILRLIPNPPGKIVDGEILFDGKDLLKMSEAEIRKIRGNRISMIFQEPSTSLNPVLTVYRQMAEGLKLHRGLNDKECLSECIRLLDLVGIPDPQKRVYHYPFQLSGGMLQRIMIAIGLSCKPDLLIADEPTTALDVTVQAQIMNLIDNLRKTTGTAVIIITHNLGLIARYVDRVNVMYAGRIVESAASEELFEHPAHPYTIGLLGSVPRLDVESRQSLKAIKGQPPLLTTPIPGCRFCDRCEFATKRCRKEYPPMTEISEGHFCSCFLNEKKRAGNGKEA